MKNNGKHYKSGKLGLELNFNFLKQVLQWKIIKNDKIGLEFNFLSKLKSVDIYGLKNHDFLRNIRKSGKNRNYI